LPNGNEKREKNNSSWFYRFARAIETATRSGKKQKTDVSGQWPVVRKSSGKVLLAGWLRTFDSPIHLLTYSPAFITATRSGKK
jgi:hypothetical protein